MRRRDGETGETVRRRDGETERRRDGETVRRTHGEMEKRKFFSPFLISGGSADHLSMT